MFCLFGAHGSFQEHDDLHHEPDDDAFQHFKHHNRAGGRQDHRDHGCPSGREVQELPDLGFSVLDGSYPPQDPWFSASLAFRNGRLTTSWLHRLPK